MAVGGCFVEHRHIADAAELHIERTGNGGRAECQHVHVGGKLLKAFLLSHAEALLLVHNEQPEVAERDVF